MKQPLPPQSPIDAKRFKLWIDHFGSYRSGITQIVIENWLGQFQKNDNDLGARILDTVEYYGQAQIHATFREALRSLEGWDASPSKRIGRWRFAAMSSSAGESGDSMLHEFRVANNLDKKLYKEMFVHRSELLKLSPTPTDTVVLLDDFSGTGSQICKAWIDPDTAFGELLAGVGRVYLVLVAASTAALNRIANETTMSVVCANKLKENDNVFSDHCKHFTKSDRTKLLHYGRIAAPTKPKGFGDCGFVVVFQHRAPNNAIPILHANNAAWSGLFPRHD